MNNSKTTTIRKMTISFPSTADLRGKQSVRATFKLSEKSIKALNLVACHLGIKQKSLFDHLIDDVQILHSIANKVSTSHFKKIIRVQKTYVLSRKTLSILEEVSTNCNAPRDALVEYSIQRLESIIQIEREKHKKRIEIFNELNLKWKDNKTLLDKYQKQLGMDDPVCIEIENAINACENAKQNIENFIEKSRDIENY